ncbi:hypothetical protein SUDANB126_00394 [Streptomyces sp. enrichment culture]
MPARLPRPYRQEPAPEPSRGGFRGGELRTAVPLPLLVRSYSSHAWIIVCSVILPSRSEIIDSESTRTPSGYTQLSL